MLPLQKASNVSRPAGERYAVMKETGKAGYVLQKVGSKKDATVKVTGRFPKLYPGMIITAEVVKKNLVSISYSEEGDHNQFILLQNRVDMDMYRIAKRRYELYFPLGFGWREAELSPEELYDKLRFSAADICHKASVGRADEPNRLKAIAKELISCGRLDGIKDYSREAFLAEGRKAQEQSAYDLLSDEVVWKLRLLPVFEELPDGTFRDVELHKMEQFVSGNVKVRNGNRFPLVSEKVIRDYLDENTLCLDEDQAAACYLLTDSAPSIVTGGAGVGKTTVVRALMDCYCAGAKKKAKDILLAAPTNRAARRLEEKTGYEAHTIHSILNIIPDEVDLNLPQYNEHNPLPYSLIVVDEASMVGTELMYRLLRAVKADAKVVFVGDANQLPPVDYGQPFIDFCASLRVHRLTINHRADNGTDLLRLHRAVLEGAPLNSGNGVTVDTIREEDIPGFIHPELTDRIQYISQYNALNARINQVCKKNPAKAFERDDKVMFLKNCKEYSNGDFGTVLAVFDDEMVIELSAGGDSISIPKDRYDEVTLAYAVTVHKMQGSEADEVVAFLPSRRSDETYTRLLYTAVTRAKKKVTIHFYKAF